MGDKGSVMSSHDQLIEILGLGQKQIEKKGGSEKRQRVKKRDVSWLYGIPFTKGVGNRE